MKLTAVAALVLALAIVGGAHAGGSGTVGARVVANPLDVTLKLSTTQVSVGTLFGAGAIVRNLGANALTSVTVSLRADPALRIVPQAPWSLGTLAGGSTTGAVWGVCAATAGNYVLIARATAGSFSAESAGQLVKVMSGNRRCK